MPNRPNPSDRPGLVGHRVRRTLLGQALPTSGERREHLGKPAGLAVPLAYAATPIKVLDETNGAEISVAASVDHFAWAADSGARPGHFNAYVNAYAPSDRAMVAMPSA
jgi:hypothetical protein